MPLLRTSTLDKPLVGPDDGVYLCTCSHHRHFRIPLYFYCLSAFQSDNYPSRNPQPQVPTGHGDTDEIASAQTHEPCRHFHLVFMSGQGVHVRIGDRLPL